MDGSAVTDSRCPGCRARMQDSPVCARCGCDLTLARRAQARARRLIARAVQAWAEADSEQARSRACDALALDCRPMAQALLRGLTAGQIARWPGVAPPKQMDAQDGLGKELGGTAPLLPSS